jgi:hypothetical protein
MLRSARLKIVVMLSNKAGMDAVAGTVMMRSSWKAPTSSVFNPSPYSHYASSRCLEELQRLHCLAAYPLLSCSFSSTSFTYSFTHITVCFDSVGACSNHAQDTFFIFLSFHLLYVILAFFIDFWWTTACIENSSRHNTCFD